MILRTRNGNDIAGLLSARESDLAVPLLLERLDLRHASDELTVVETVNGNRLGHELSIDLLDHVHDLLLDEFQIVGVARRSAADDVVDLDVIIILANATTVHGVGELDKDRVLLHDALDVLTSNADNALVVLVRYVERNGSWHLKLHKIQSTLCCLVLRTAHVNVEVVLVEAIKDNLHIALTHDLVDFAVLLAADELLVLIRELDLNTQRALGALQERKAVDDRHSSLDRVVAAIDVEVELLERDLSTRVDADIGKHGPDVRRSRLSLVRVGSGDPPRSTVELASQAHDLTDSPLDVQNIRCLYAEHAACVSKRRKKHIGAVRLDDLANLVQTLQQDVVDLAGSDVHILDKRLGCHDQVVKSLLCLQDVIHCVSRDDDLVSSTQRNRARRRVAKHRWEHGREVDRSAGGGLDHLDVAAVTARNETVQ